MENKVELIGYYGGDETHAASAWTSSNRTITPEKKLRLPEFLKFLADHGHHTPFEKSMFHFLVTCETATHIQFLKHRIGVSVNAESARYKELKLDKWYAPNDWQDRELLEKYEMHIQDSYELYHILMKELTPKLGRQRAKESARFVLPYANQLILDVSFNFRSFMHFQKLRNEINSQLEIRELAQKMLELVRETGQFKLSLSAFGY